MRDGRAPSPVVHTFKIAEVLVAPGDQADAADPPCHRSGSAHLAILGTELVTCVLRGDIARAGSPVAATAATAATACDLQHRNAAAPSSIDELLDAATKSSFERVGHEVGTLYWRAQPRIEEALIQAYAAPIPIPVLLGSAGDAAGVLSLALIEVLRPCVMVWPEHVVMSSSVSSPASSLLYRTQPRRQSSRAHARHGRRIQLPAGIKDRSRVRASQQNPLNSVDLTASTILCR